MIGLDTTAIIDIFKGEKNIKQLLQRLNEQIASTQINYQEVLFGLDLVDNVEHQHEKEYYDSFFRNLRYFSLDDSSVVSASEIYWQFNKLNKEIGKFDCMIASILLENGVSKIITRNVKHFEGIKGLKVISY